METGHVIRFAKQKNPFLVEAEPCPDLDCSCSTIKLTFSELVPPVSAPCERLTFTLRVCLTPRSLEVESLVHEFLARFPSERIQELADQFERTRASERRVKSLLLSGSRDELVTFSSVVDERGGVREGSTDRAYFFMFEGREFVVEDHYCANPECDCKLVHLEFWERVYEVYPKRSIRIRQQIMATFTLAGKLKEIRFSEESSCTTEHLLRAWLRRCRDHFPECRRRYEIIKAIGARSFPRVSKPQSIVVSEKSSRPGKRTLPKDSQQAVRRNDPCPCGSGLKFKRCCARRTAVMD